MEHGDLQSMEDKIASAFAQMASEYCAFLRQVRDQDLPRWLRDAARILARLAEAGFALPDVDLEGDDEPTEEPEQLHLPDFGRWDAHRLVFHPYEHLQEPVVGVLSDDLTDIDTDLRRGLEIYHGDAPSASNDAIWYWRLHFSHWGQHTLSALYAIHWALQEVAFEDDEQ